MSPGKRKLADIELTSEGLPSSRHRPAARTTEATSASSMMQLDTWMSSSPPNADLPRPALPPRSKGQPTQHQPMPPRSRSTEAGQVAEPEDHRMDLDVSPEEEATGARTANAPSAVPQDPWRMVTIHSLINQISRMGRVCADQIDYAYVKDWLDSHPEVEDSLRQASLTPDCRAVDEAMADAVAVHGREAEERKYRRISDLGPKMDEAVSRSWTRPYVGDSGWLLDQINALDRKGKYRNAVLFMNSSGTGKSRIVHEQALLVPTIPFNLRPDVETNQMAYPPPDPEIRNFLRKLASDPETAKSRCGRLLDEIFRHVLLELKDFQPQESAAGLAAALRNHLEQHGVRQRLYKAAVSACSKDPSTKHDDAQTDASSSNATKLLNRIQELTTAEAPDNSKSPNVMLLLYFDEVHVLTGPLMSLPSLPSVAGQVPNMYDVLCSCLADLPADVFTIFLSTSSLLKELAPEGVVARSARQRQMGHRLPAPITKILFDCSPRLPLHPEQLTLRDLSKLEYLAQFGRVLFWTLIEASKPEQMTEILQLAMTKLIDKHNFETLQDEQLKVPQQVAILDSALQVDLEPRRELASALVAHHMQIAFSVPQHHAYVRSGYPSEPFLAEANLQLIRILQRNRVSVGKVLPAILQKTLKERALDKGHRGELVVRMLLLMAYMDAVDVIDVPSRTTESFYSRGCRLMEFIKALFSEEYAEQILNSHPDTTMSTLTFCETFKNAVVRFTHFVRMADDSGPSTENLLSGFLRATAFIGWSSQIGGDIFVPFLLDKDGPLAESNISLLCLSVKNRKMSGSSARYNVHHRDLGVYPRGCTDSRAYITIITEVGVQRPPATAKNKTHYHQQTTSVSSQTSESPSSSLFLQPMATQVITQRRGQRCSSRLAPSVDQHPRFNVYVYGCSPSVYKVVEEDDQATYAFLLGARDVLDEELDRSLSAHRMLQQMLPVWTRQSHTWRVSSMPEVDEGNVDGWEDAKLVIVQEGEPDADG